METRAVLRFSSGILAIGLHITILYGYHLNDLSMITSKYVRCYIELFHLDWPILPCAIIKTAAKQWIILVVVYHCLVRVLYVDKYKFVSRVLRQEFLSFSLLIKLNIKCRAEFSIVFFILFYPRRIGRYDFIISIQSVTALALGLSILA